MDLVCRYQSMDKAHSQSRIGIIAKHSPMRAFLIVLLLLQWHGSVANAQASSTDGKDWTLSWLGCTPADETPYFSLRLNASGSVSYIGGQDVYTKTQRINIPAVSASKLLAQLQRA